MKAFLVNRVGDFGFILGIGCSLPTPARWTTPKPSPRARLAAGLGDRQSVPGRPVDR